MIKKLNTISFSPCSTKILTSSEDRTAKLIDLEGEILQVFNNNDYVTCANFSPCGKYIALSTAETQVDNVKIWNLNGDFIASCKADTYWVHSVVFSPNGNSILTTSDNHKEHLKLWNLEGKLIQSFYGHENGVEYALFTSDGKLIISVSSDNTIKIWNLQGKELHTLIGHQDTILHASISPDGNCLVTVDVLGIAKTWFLDKEELIQQANQRGIAFLNSKEMNEQKLDDIDQAREFDRVAALLEENEPQRMFQFAEYYNFLAIEKPQERKRYLKQAKCLYQKLVKEHDLNVYKWKLKDIQDVFNKEFPELER